MAGVSALYMIVNKILSFSFSVMLKMFSFISTNQN